MFIAKITTLSIMINFLLTASSDLVPFNFGETTSRSPAFVERLRSEGFNDCGLEHFLTSENKLLNLEKLLKIVSVDDLKFLLNKETENQVCFSSSLNLLLHKNREKSLLLSCLLEDGFLIEKKANPNIADIFNAGYRNLAFVLIFEANEMNRAALKQAFGRYFVGQCFEFGFPLIEHSASSVAKFLFNNAEELLTRKIVEKGAFAAFARSVQTENWSNAYKIRKVLFTKKYFSPDQDLEQSLLDNWFVSACNSKDTDELKKVLSEDIDNIPSFDLWGKALDVFVKNKNLEFARFILNHSKAPDNFARNALGLYAEFGNLKAVNSLLSKNESAKHAPTQSMVDDLFLKAVREENTSVFELIMVENNRQVSVSVMEEALKITPQKPRRNIFDFSFTVTLESHPMHKAIYKKLGIPDPRGFLTFQLDLSSINFFVKAEPLAQQ